jgi:[ribosomal protein S18]-alanine N-acetyltransferase
MIVPITVRRSRKSDLDRVLEIEHASFGVDAYDRNLFAEFFHICPDLFLVAVQGDLVCGYLVACVRRQLRAGIRTAELVSIAVDPGFRGRGVASHMLKSIFGRLRRRQVDRFTLMVRVSNDPARAIYEKYGFRRVRIVRRYYADGGDALVMARSLNRRGLPAS